MYVNTTVKFTLDSEESPKLLASIIGCAVRDVLERAALELAPTGIGVRVRPQGGVVNVPALDVEAA
ncbi:MAG: hypothetical protein ABSB24_20025 [Gaiellaceae bacterium]|jgi:hypothetical protein